MTAEWTTERLDALPEGTLIDVEWSTYTERLAKPAPGKWWAVNLGDRPEQCDTSSEDLADNPHVKSICVVSVPVDALLDDDAVLEIVGDLMLEDGDPWNVLQGAIAHVTGEAS